MKAFIPLLVLFLTGCASNMPTCSATVTTSCINPWWSVLEGIQPQPEGRDYSVDPVQVPLVQNQWRPVPNSYSNQHNGSQRFIMNTPNGLVYRTCRNMSSDAVYCF